ncbi:Flp family type IVb pilin [Salinibacterium sp. GXW1014]|uniref:Flp family type IVb pilin n=1 Tax=Salinibacterium sp. GXW1014 TaxID=3377838 RepID=UPI00383B1675
MTKFLLTLQSFVDDRLGRDERGASAVEYAILIGVIVVVVAAALWAFGDQLSTFFTGILPGSVGSTKPTP